MSRVSILRCAEWLAVASDDNPRRKDFAPLVRSFMTDWYRSDSFPIRVHID